MGFKKKKKERREKKIHFMLRFIANLKQGQNKKEETHGDKSLEESTVKKAWKLIKKKVVFSPG